METKQGFAKQIGRMIKYPFLEYYYRKGFSEASQTDSWTSEQIQEYQDKMLVTLVRFAAKNIPFYRDLYSRSGVDLRTFSGIADMHKLPTINKKDILNSFEKMVNPHGFKFLRNVCTTGGSTGTIATLTRPKSLGAYSLGCTYALWKRIGVARHDKIVRLRGTLLDGGKSLFKRNDAKHRMFISTYHLNDDSVEEIIKLIDDYQPSWLHVYPSALTLLATTMKRTGRHLSCKLKGILCGSENVFAWQIDLFNQIFMCPTFSHFGHEEATGMASWCEGAQSYHFLPNYGYIELLDESQNIINASGISGEITGTGFAERTIMPLIRYRTADYGIRDKLGPCPACGRNHQRLSTIEGRIQEFLILKDGTKFPATNINALHGDFFSNLYRFQFLQDKAGEAIFQFVPASELTAAKMQDIKNALHFLEELGLAIRFNPVKEIALTPRGKQRIVIANENLR